MRTKPPELMTAVHYLAALAAVLSIEDMTRLKVNLDLRKALQEFERKGDNAPEV